MHEHLGEISPGKSGDEVLLERTLGHPIDVVWKALTQPEELRIWLMETTVLELRIGGEIGFAEDGMGPPGVISVLDPPRVLEFTWHTDARRPASTVRFELSETAGGTHLVLRHRNNATTDMAIEHAAGWHTHLDWLSASLDDTELIDFWPRFHQLEPLYRGAATN